MSSLPLEHLRHSPVWEEVDGGTLVVACSGGPDSVAMARAAHALLRQPSFAAHFSAKPQLVLWHLDHGLRPESAQDAAFVSELAAQLGIPVVFESAELHEQAATPGVNPEELARVERYRRLLNLLTDPAPEVPVRSPACALTAHHQGDQAETVLHHLLRGTHLAGLRGIAPRRDKLIYRPWLRLPRADIMAYLDGLAQEFRIDASNQDQRLTRNRLRHSVLPVLRELNPRAEAHIARLANLAAIATEEIASRLAALPVEEFSKGETDRWLPLLAWPAGGYSVYRLDVGWRDQELLALFVAQLLKDAGQSLATRDYDTLSDWASGSSDVLSLLEHVIQLPHPALLTITTPPRRLAEAPQAELSAGRNLSIGGLTALLREAGSALEGSIGQPEPWQRIRHWPETLAELTSLPPTRTSWHCALPTSIQQPLTLRAWQPGDRITLPSGGTKKLQDTFTDIKVPQPFRQVWAVLADATGEVLWVPGLADSAAMAEGKQQPAWLLTIRDNM